MSLGEWKGNHIVEANKTLILGESHYDDAGNIGLPVDFATSGVVEAYLSHRESGGERVRWDRFFDRIAESFGYEPIKSRDFYDKVWFGNYVPVICGKGEMNRAKDFIKQNRTEYNDSLFEFVNQNCLSTVVCFSKTVFWNLPAVAD